MKLPKSKQGALTGSHKRSKGQEKELAVRLGGQQIRGSGCGREKGDVRVKGFVRVEAKTTKHDSFRVTREMIEKIEKAALPNGEIPVLVVELNGEPKQECAIIPAWALDLLLSKIKNHGIAK